jgi:hypothetical protein
MACLSSNAAIRIGWVAAFVLLVAAGCEKKGPATRVVVGGVVGFDQTAVARANHPMVKAEASVVCGADGPVFGAELFDTEPQNARVVREWGEIVPGKQMYVAGTIQETEFSDGDLQFTHPYNKDITFNIVAQEPYKDLVQVLGRGTDSDAGHAGDALHWELSRDLFPHVTPSAYLDGFLPQKGYAVASYGHWIIDCGHNDYHSELHPPTFLALGWVDTESGATLSTAFYIPYYETQLFTPNPSLVNDFGNPGRFSAPDTQTFPSYLYHQLLAVGHLGDPATTTFLDRLEAHQMLDANRHSPVTWYVCAQGPRPAKASGLSISMAFTVRPGVTLASESDASTGCVRLTATIGPSYTALVPTRKDCSSPWGDVNQQAQAALGNPNIDFRNLIADKVPASYRDAVLRDPVVDCYDPLVVPPPGDPNGHPGVVTSADQPYPFYGEASVAWRTDG